MESTIQSTLTRLASAPITVDEDAGLDAAAQLMRQQHVGSLVVTHNGTPAGLVTDRDLAMAALRRPKGTSIPKVSEVASKPLLTLDVRATLEEATELFGRYGIRRLGLIAPDGELVGVLSSDMVLVHLGEQLSAITTGIRREFQEERSPTSSVTTGFGHE